MNELSLALTDLAMLRHAIILEAAEQGVEARLTGAAAVAVNAIHHLGNFAN